MKKIGSFLIDVVIVAWFLVAIFVTICLLSYNDFSVTVFGKNTFLIVDSDEMEPDYVEGDLLIIKRNSDSKIDVGDKVFYYNSAMDSSIFVFMNEVQKKEEISRNQYTYTLDNLPVSSDYIIGKTDTTKVIHNMGKILAVFTSKWGFMFLIIFPTLFAIIYEIMMIIDFAKSDRDDGENEKSTVSS